MDECTKKAEDKHEQCVKDLDNSFNHTKLNEMVDEMDKLKKSIDDDKKRLKTDKNNVELKNRIVRKKLELDVLKENIKEDRTKLKNNRKNYTRGKTMCTRALTEDKKHCKDETKKYETYQELMFQKC